MKTTLLLISISIILYSCNNGYSIEPEKEVSEKETIAKPKTPIVYSPILNRNNLVTQLKKKVQTNQPLVVHVLVPLCDNIHQGIVPTTESLGNGQSLRSNLYWATSNGRKRYFKEKKSWKLLQSIKDVYKDSVVLERVVFKRTYPNQATVYIVADAYRGDKMLNTLNHFSRAMSNSYTKKITLPDSSSIDIHGGADLVVFNGHNGLLDFTEDTPTKYYNTT